MLCTTLLTGMHSKWFDQKLVVTGYRQKLDTLLGLLFAYLPHICLCLCPSVCLSFSVCHSFSVCLCLSLSLSLSVFICLCLCLSLSKHPLIGVTFFIEPLPGMGEVTMFYRALVLTNLRQLSQWFSFSGSSTWNSLPPKLKTFSSLCNFEMNLRKFLHSALS